MDESVLRGMSRWPNVPMVFGYLRLDERGHWILQGRRLEHIKTIAFMNRNYDRDDHGRWYFQNGPQRVFVTLSYTPWVYRLTQGIPTTHTGLAVNTVKNAWVDDQGRLLLETEHGPGLIHDQDLPEAVERLTGADGGRLDPDTATEGLERLMAGEMPGDDRPAMSLDLAGTTVMLNCLRARDVAERFGYTPLPAPLAGETAKARICRD